MAHNIPAKLLDRIHVIDEEPIAIAMCPDFEFGSWRYKQLAEHLFDWLPEVALRPKERERLLYEPNKLLSHAARRLFDTDDPSSRGELGEILIHAICRQEFSTTPFVARLFYKMRSNDSVTNVDIVHCLQNPETGTLELWLGEAKLYSDLSSAKYEAIKSIEPLWDPEFLAEMKALIGPKLEPGMEMSDELAWLFLDETSLDKIVDRLVIPICIACDMDETKTATTRTQEYTDKIATDLAKLRKYIQDRVPTTIRFVCIFVPMDDKEKLENSVNLKVQAFL